MPDALEPPADLERRLAEAGAEELLALVEELAGRLEPKAARRALRNPHATAELVARLAAEQRLLAVYEVRRDLALHPRAPEALALRLVPGLFWRDLLALGADTRVRPTVRRAAELHLAERLPGLAVGEKAAIARRASPSLIALLRHDPSVRVVAALLDNPRLTEGLLEPLAHSAQALPPVLDLIAADRRWGARHALRAALARNPRTPLATALRLLPSLKKPELRAVAVDPRSPEPVRRRARLLAGMDRDRGSLSDSAI